MIISFLIGSIHVLLLSRKLNYSITNILNYLFILIAGGFLSSLIVGLIFYPYQLNISSGNSIPLISWGGLIGGIIIIILIGYYWKENIFQLYDLFIPGYACALAIGRIGCFFAGCCYGKHTNNWWGITFSNSMAPASHAIQPLVPVQLISSLFLFLLSGFLSFSLIRKFSDRGFTFMQFLFIYSIFRFIVEFMRDDPRIFIFGLSDGQNFSILLFLFGVALYLYRKNNYFKTVDNCHSLHS